LLYGARDLDTDAARLQLLGVMPVSEAAGPDDAQKALQDFLRQDGTRSPMRLNRNFKALSDWLQANGVDVPLPVFLDGAEHADDRRRAVGDLLG